MRFGLKYAVIAALSVGAMAALPANSTANSTAANSMEVAPITIEISDGVFTPRQIEVPAGKTIEFIIRNTGADPAEFESQRLRKEKVVAAGAEIQITIRNLAPGSYEFFDDFHNDLDSAHGVIIAK